ncbi:MAG: hypothetical protein RLT05_31955, partial [Bauldia litoralis]
MNSSWSIGAAAAAGALAAAGGLVCTASAQSTLPTLRPTTITTATSAARSAMRPMARPTLRPEIRTAEPAAAPAPKDRGRVTTTAATGGTYRIVAVGDTMIGSDFPSPILYSPLTRDASPAKILGPTLAR